MGFRLVFEQNIIPHKSLFENDVEAGQPLKSDAEKTLEELVKANPMLWRGRSQNRIKKTAIDSGFAELNTILPLGGWPLKSVIEFVVHEWGSGELQLLLPLMRHFSLENRRLALVSPPYLPYAPAFYEAGIALDRLVVIDNKTPGHEKWWCAEKMLGHGDCGLVLLWPDRPQANSVRRLQIAADAGCSIGVLFNRGEPIDTPVSLRFSVRYCKKGIAVNLLKSRFGWELGSAIIPFRDN